MKVKVDNFINENSTLIKGVLTAPLVGVVAGAIAVAKARKIKVEFKRGALFKALKCKKISKKNSKLANFPIVLFASVMGIGGLSLALKKLVWLLIIKLF